jgi:hypothetical protein
MNSQEPAPMSPDPVKYRRAGWLRPLPQTESPKFHIPEEGWLGSSDPQGIDATATQRRHAPNVGPAGDLADDSLVIPAMQLKPPWQVLHTRALLTGVGVAAATALGYGVFHLWWEQRSNPFNYLVLERMTSQGPISAAPEATPPNVPAPAPGAQPTRQGAEPARLPAATGPAHRSVTHTKPAEGAPVAAAEKIAPGSRACTEGIAALGLCSPVPEEQGK